jgi:hypothetical protein
MPELGFTITDTVKASGGGKILLCEKGDDGVAINIFSDYFHAGYVLVIIPIK